MTEQLDIFSAPTARNTDPPTAHGAAVVAIFSAKTNRAHALIALVEAGDDGLTDFELAIKTGVQQTSIGKRRHELMSLGLVQPAVERCEESKRHPTGVRPVTRLSPSGTPAQVWQITPAGLEYAYGLGLTGAVAS